MEWRGGQGWMGGQGGSQVCLREVSCAGVSAREMCLSVRERGCVGA